MRNFEIFTDSCSDLPLEYVKDNNLKYGRMACSLEDKHYIDDFGQDLSYKEFYNGLRNGIVPKTSQPTTEEFYTKFKQIVEEGKDLIYICVSTGLSGTENGANIAKNMVLEEYPDCKIVIVNTLTASLNQGIIVMKAIEMKKQGKTIDEIEEYIKSIRKNFNTYMTVDDLHYLKKGGRLSTATALMGIVLHVKPILSLNSEGKVIAVGKARGKKTVIKKLADIVATRIIDPEKQVISISHGDDLESAIALKNQILSKIQVKDILINYCGIAVGAYGGPGCLSVGFIGKERQESLIER